MKKAGHENDLPFSLFNKIFFRMTSPERIGQSIMDSSLTMESQINVSSGDFLPTIEIHIR